MLKFNYNKEDYIHLALMVKNIELIIYDIDFYDDEEEIKRYLISWFNDFKNDFHEEYVSYIRNEKDYNNDYYIKLYKYCIRLYKLPDIQDSIYSILYILTNDFDCNCYGTIYIDKKYYKLNINNCKHYSVQTVGVNGVYRLILDIPIQYYKNIVKTFDEYYIENFYNDNNEDEYIIYSNCNNILSYKNIRTIEYVE